MTSGAKTSFDVKTFLQSPGLRTKAVDYAASSVVYAQGAACDSVYFIQQGSVSLSVLSSAGKEAILGVLHGGEFFGATTRPTPSR